MTEQNGPAPLPAKAVDLSNKVVQGVGMRLPPGVTPEQRCREGMAMEAATGMLKDDVARKLGIDRATYTRMREIVQLYDLRHELAAADCEKVTQAFEHMQVTKTAVRAHIAVAPVIAKVWGNSKKNQRSIQERADDFETRVEVVTEACRAAGMLTVPHLTSVQAGTMIVQLKKAQRDLGKLIEKLKEFTCEDTR